MDNLFLLLLFVAILAAIMTVAAFISDYWISKDWERINRDYRVHFIRRMK